MTNLYTENKLYILLDKIISTNIYITHTTYKPCINHAKTKLNASMFSGFTLHALDMCWHNEMDHHRQNNDLRLAHLLRLQMYCLNLHCSDHVHGPVHAHFLRQPLIYHLYHVPCHYPAPSHYLKYYPPICICNSKYINLSIFR